jgi:hypothetical protein
MWRLTAVLILVQEILDLLVVVEAAHQVLVLLCLRLRLLMEATAAQRLCIMGRIMAVVVAGLLRLRVRTAHRAKAEAAALRLLQVAATGLLVRPQRRHRSAWRIQVAAEVAARTPWVDILVRQVVRAS